MVDKGILSTGPEGGGGWEVMEDGGQGHPEHRARGGGGCVMEDGGQGHPEHRARGGGASPSAACGTPPPRPPSPHDSPPPNVQNVTRAQKNRQVVSFSFAVKACNCKTKSDQRKYAREMRVRNTLSRRVFVCRKRTYDLLAFNAKENPQHNPPPTRWWMTCSAAVAARVLSAPHVPTMCCRTLQRRAPAHAPAIRWAGGPWSTPRTAGALPRTARAAHCRWRAVRRRAHRGRPYGQRHSGATGQMRSWDRLCPCPSGRGPLFVSFFHWGRPEFVGGRIHATDGGWRSTDGGWALNRRRLADDRPLPLAGQRDAEVRAPPRRRRDPSPPGGGPHRRSTTIS